MVLDLLLKKEVVDDVLAAVKVLLGLPGELLPAVELHLVPGLLLHNLHRLQQQQYY